MPRPTELPKWVWDLTMTLQKHEDEHQHPKAGGLCLQSVLNLVPEEVRDQAAAISSYARFEEPTMGRIDGFGIVDTAPEEPASA